MDIRARPIFCLCHCVSVLGLVADWLPVSTAFLECRLESSSSGSRVQRSKLVGSVQSCRLPGPLAGEHVL